MANAGRVMPGRGGSNESGAAGSHRVGIEAEPCDGTRDGRQRRYPFRVVEHEHSAQPGAPGGGENDVAALEERRGPTRFEEFVQFGEAQIRGGNELVEVLHELRFGEDGQIFERPGLQPSMERAIKTRFAAGELAEAT